jgi:DNA-binding MarR family transcriptional regulator
MIVGRQTNFTAPSDGGAASAGTPAGLADPIAEAQRQWVAHDWEPAATGMAVVTSVMRVHQIYLARVNELLAPYGLTFARFELLALLGFTRRGSLPMKKIGVRLQVHPASITNAVDRLEEQGLVRRVAREDDRRSTLVEILPRGRRVVERATRALNATVFESPGLSRADAEKLVALLGSVRAAHGDFEA